MKIFEGVVKSVKMNQTAVVEITRRTPHPMYGKLIKRSKKYKVDTAGAELSVGQTVKIVETKPVSKDKYFKIVGGNKPVVKEAAEKKTASKAATTKKVAKPRAVKKGSK
jgi:small subunit ribosomal protein S17